MRIPATSTPTVRTPRQESPTPKANQPSERHGETDANGVLVLDPRRHYRPEFFEFLERRGISHRFMIAPPLFQDVMERLAALHKP